MALTHAKPQATPTSAALPPVWAGPILRRTDPGRVVLWLALSAPVPMRITFRTDSGYHHEFDLTPGSTPYRCAQAGERLHYALLDLVLEDPALPQDEWVWYEISLQHADGRWLSQSDWASDCCFANHPSPGFVLHSQVRAAWHGSCRKPHSDTADGLALADTQLETLLREAGATGPSVPTRWPSLLLFTGDQIYADDVAGPMLSAIHEFIVTAGLADEVLPGPPDSLVDTATQLYSHADSYYRREQLLPVESHTSGVFDVLFGGARKPIFTALGAHNHLVTLAELLAMYLLVWSPAPWAGLALKIPDGLDTEQRDQYLSELTVIRRFVAGLAKVRRLMAHVPVAMIFDDHDVSDDWNLNRAWEEAAYSHRFAHRIIGNALLAYFVNQGWGNRPDAFEAELLDDLTTAMASPGGASYDETLQRLLQFQGWHFAWPSKPALVVLDTRTRRWRSESAAHKPSGLLDWEALTELQQDILGQDAIMVVSAPPIFGVKLIEAIQRVFTLVGQPLMVDAENWMAHPGTASGILNIFRHPRTPDRFVILSGDVHYSFVYDVELRGRRGGPHIWQICSSGLRNEFPHRLLDWLDRANRWLYSPRSPLNWFTRRRRMRIVPRRPQGIARGRRLLNASGIGIVELDDDGAPRHISELTADGEVVFVRREDEAHWD